MLSFCKNFIVRASAIVFTIGLIMPVVALEPEPHKWSHLPVGANFVGAAYGYTEADIFINPALQLEDVDLELHTWAVKYIRTFDLLGHSARVDITQAYQEGRWEGLLKGVPAATTREGAADSFVRFAVNLLGAPAMQGKAFGAYRASRKTETIVGVGLAIRLPTGQYNEDKLINLGKNRYAFRPQLGAMHTWGKWTAELTAEAAFYTDNDDFFNGNKLEQDPLYILHGHLIFTFRPGFWTVASFAYDRGGETTINGVDKDDRQQDIAWALSVAYPLSRTMGLKATYIGSRTQESTGLDSETLSVSLAYLW